MTPQSLLLPHTLIDGFSTRHGDGTHRSASSPIAPTRIVEPRSSQLVTDVFLSTPRISVFIPTTSNPPQRLPIPARTFAAFESWMDRQGWGWTRLPGLALGSYTSEPLSVVRDECRVYSVLAPTTIAANDIGARIYAYVAEHFEQENVLLEYDAVPTTLFNASLRRRGSLDLGLISLSVDGSCQSTTESLRALLRQETVDLCERRLSDGRFEFAALCSAEKVGEVFAALDDSPRKTFEVLSPDVGWGERASNVPLAHSCDCCGDAGDAVSPLLLVSGAVCEHGELVAIVCPACQEEPS